MDVFSCCAICQTWLKLFSVTSKRQYFKIFTRHCKCVFMRQKDARTDKTWFPVLSSLSATVPYKCKRLAYKRRYNALDVWCGFLASFVWFIDASFANEPTSVFEFPASRLKEPWYDIYATFCIWVCASLHVHTFYGAFLMTVDSLTCLTQAVSNVFHAHESLAVGCMQCAKRAHQRSDWRLTQANKGGFLQSRISLYVVQYSVVCGVYFSVLLLCWFCACVYEIGRIVFPVYYSNGLFACHGTVSSLRKCTCSMLLYASRKRRKILFRCVHIHWHFSMSLFFGLYGNILLRRLRSRCKFELQWTRTKSKLPKFEFQTHWLHWTNFALRGVEMLKSFLVYVMQWWLRFNATFSLCISFNLQLDLQLQDEQGGDLTSFVTNGEWSLLGK